jgi:hypothetical protein
MNTLVKRYIVDTCYPNVSGIEHLQMLQTRSQLAEIETTLNPEEHRLLAEADQRLLTHRYEFWTEISRFADLAEERQRIHPPSNQWWWYLDVLAQLPRDVMKEPISEPTSA